MRVEFGRVKAPLGRRRQGRCTDIGMSGRRLMTDPGLRYGG
jgi:hypothetical protein